MADEIPPPAKPEPADWKQRVAENLSRVSPAGLVLLVAFYGGFEYFTQEQINDQTLILELLSKCGGS